MRRTQSFSKVFLIAIFILSTMGLTASPTSADETKPRRVQAITVPVTIYEWWLASWEENTILCRIYLEEEGKPGWQEILWACGPELTEVWSEGGSCPNLVENDVRGCSGTYLHLAAVTPTTKAVEVELPEATVTISLSGCSLDPGSSYCDELPVLLFNGQEPLPNEGITAIKGSIEGNSFACPGSTCTVELDPTPLSGVSFSFYAESSFGDTSKLYNGFIRVLQAYDSGTPDGWYVDVLSSQWRGSDPQSCMQSWEVFPAPGGPPPWLSTPPMELYLSTEGPLYQLAGVLISNGFVEAYDCPDLGLLPNGAASECGLSRARELVDEWQNQFDMLILDASLDAGIPAMMLKRLFAHESQFWPGIYDDVNEAGLGHLTVEGADTTLLWNEAFYESFCPLVLDTDACELGYSNLDDENQEMLRGALFNKVNARCDDCPLGIDLSQAEFSIRLFADTLLANCEQVGRMVLNTSGTSPGAVSTYEDMWKMTLANYNVGPGCLANAMSRAWRRNKLLTWDVVSQEFSSGCQNALDYVDAIAR
jgi:hypothetical protein